MSNYSLADIKEFIEENDVKFIRLAFCDMYGNQKNISIMPGELDEACNVGVGIDAFRILGLNDPQYQDLFLVPDLDTIHVLPWRPSSGRVIRFYCNLFLPDGELYPYDTRKFLKDTMDICQKMDFVTRLGLKSEFYLFKQDEEGNPTDVPFDNGGYFDVSPRDKGENFRREVCLSLEEMGIAPKSSHHEAGPGQMEIDFAESDALSIADHFVTYKNVVENIASRNGIYASFDPKPIADKPGNGLHISVSTWRDDINIEDVDPEFTMHFMAGVFNRMKDITVFLNCREDSYLRFGHNEAPKYISWSSQNRSRLLRVPMVRGRKLCFVLRSPDSCINPYLACAMIIQAGIAGINNKEVLPAPQDVSSRLLSEEELNKREKLPESLEEAIGCARNSDFVQKSEFAEIANRFIDEIEQDMVCRRKSDK